jgi:gliding motility-associated lipoprotein GldH
MKKMIPSFLNAFVKEFFRFGNLLINSFLCKTKNSFSLRWGKYWLLFTPLLLLSACEEENLYDKSEGVNSEGWGYAERLDYEFEIQDTSKLHSLLLDISHNTEYPYQNLYLRIGTEFPSGKTLEQTLSSDLADKQGKWYGDCSGNTCVAHINLQEKALFTEVGKHRISIGQHSRDSSLTGVNGLRLMVREYAENE